MTPASCPNCGARVPRGAQSCPECGSDEETGWSDSANASSLDLPDEDFNYDEFVKQEFGGKTKSVKPHGLRWLWYLTALILLIVLLFFYFR
jgi:uncharacterized membrane protein YvbJ